MPGRPPLYPWSTWLDARFSPLQLVRGVDFAPGVNLKSLRAQAISQARKRKVRIATQIWNEDSLVIRVLGSIPGVDFDELLDGKAHMLTTSVDFDMPVYEFTQMLMREAYRRKVDAKLRQVDHMHVVVQAFPLVITSEPSDDLEVNHA